MISPRIIRAVFLYFRTKRNIVYSPDERRAFLDCLPEPSQMGSELFGPHDPTTMPPSILDFGEDGVTWEDGFVVRFRSYMAPSDISNRADHALRAFDGWAIHDGCGDFVENPSGGLLSRFFEQIPQKTQPIPLCQIFVIGQDHKFDETIDQMRSSMKSGSICLPVFHYRDGRILFLHSEEPGNITAHHCKKYLRRFKYWAIVDSAGRCFSANGTEVSIWQDVPREEDDEEEDNA